jgi:deoxycytidine triphosphate deaminase
MFGNLITNRQLKQLIKQNDVQIVPFKESNLKQCHYTLGVGRIYIRLPDGEVQQVHSFKEPKNGKAYELKGNGYVIIEAYEAIKLPNAGIAGRFITTSSLIESGLCLVAGQIGNRYGTNGESVRFGLKNLLDDPFLIDKDFRIAHVEFFDIRGITSETVPITPEEKRLWLKRAIRDIDSGINPMDDEV